MAAELGIDQDAITGKLVRLWSWADQTSRDGHAVSVTSAFLDRLTICPGFAAALRKVGWLTGEDGNLCFPNFELHNGETAKARALTNRRQAKFRNGSNDSVTLPALRRRLPEERRGEEEGDARGSSPLNPHFSPPAWEQVKSESVRLLFPEDQALRFFKEMESVGWVDGARRPLRNWRIYLSKKVDFWRDAEGKKKAKERLKAEQKAEKEAAKKTPARTPKVEPIRGFDD